jgi:hypothetical protein
MAKSTAPIHIENVARVGGKEVLFVTTLRSAVRIQKRMMEHRLGKYTGSRRSGLDVNQRWVQWLSGDRDRPAFVYVFAVLVHGGTTE